MLLSSFRTAPRIGHLARAKRIIGYLAKMKHGCIRFRTGTPDYSDLPIPTYDWASSVYNDPKEVMPMDAPKPLGRKVVTTHYVDASPCHDKLTGKAVTATLHFVNQTPIDWYPKKQATVETATYGSEFVAARTCAEQIIDLRSTLRFHRVREAIASGMIVFTFIPGWLNPADILSKHWSYKAVWMNLKTPLFWQGDTEDIEEVKK
jgi:hypothetical protein